jgi:hypothetical protein
MGVLEDGEKDNGQESWPMTPGQGVGAVFHGDMRHTRDGLPGGHGRCEVPTIVSSKWQVLRGEMCIVTCEWQDEYMCMSQFVNSVYQ